MLKKLIEEGLIEKLMQKDEQDLSLKDLERVVYEDGKTVAHVMVWRGYKFTDKRILKLASESGWTVAHEMAGFGHKFTDKDVLKLRDKNGLTVAHVMASQGHEFTDKEILKLADKDGWTVAHAMAVIGGAVTDKEILKLSDKRGVTVAYEMARHGYKISDKEVLEGVYKENRQRLSDLPSYVSQPFIETLELIGRVFSFVDRQSEHSDLAKKLSVIAFKLKEQEKLRLSLKKRRAKLQERV